MGFNVMVILPNQTEKLGPLNFVTKRLVYELLKSAATFGHLLIGANRPLELKNLSTIEEESIWVLVFTLWRGGIRSR